MTHTALTLTEALAQLRDYAADEVADLLRLAGKTGDVGELTTCPIAHYLQDVLGQEVSVDSDVAWLNEDYATIELPDGVMAFVDAFDHYDYEDLITEDERT